MIVLRNACTAALPALTLGAALLIAVTARFTLLLLRSIDSPNFLAILFAFLRVTVREVPGIFYYAGREVSRRELHVPCSASGGSAQRGTPLWCNI